MPLEMLGPWCFWNLEIFPIYIYSRYPIHLPLSRVDDGKILEKLILSHLLTLISIPLLENSDALLTLFAFSSLISEDDDLRFRVEVSFAINVSPLLSLFPVSGNFHMRPGLILPFQRIQ